MNNSMVGLFIFGFASVVLVYVSRKKRNHGENKKKRNSLILYPPFPEIIVKILKSSRLCFLSTTDGAGNILFWRFNR